MVGLAPGLVALFGSGEQLGRGGKVARCGKRCGPVPKLERSHVLLRRVRVVYFSRGGSLSLVDDLDMADLVAGAQATMTSRPSTVEPKTV